MSNNKHIIYKHDEPLTVDILLLKHQIRQIFLCVWALLLKWPMGIKKP